MIAVSTDSHFSQLARDNTQKKEGGLELVKYPLLADTSKDLAKKYGVLLEGEAQRGLFIIDQFQKVRSIQVNDDLVGRNVDEVLRSIQAL